MMIDFVGKKKIFFSISIALMAIILISTFIFGVNLAIEFKGGTLITYSYSGELDKGEFQSLVESTLGESVSLQESADIRTGKNNLVISLASTSGISSEQQSALSQAVIERFADNELESVSISNVDASIGGEFLAKSLVAVAVASLLLVVYIALRFKRISGWSAGIFSVVALIHDVIIVYGVFLLFRISIDSNFMAVVLTILGYSINDTIVIYDRIRENRRTFGNKYNVRELVNRSVNQCLGRTINTTISSVLALAAISVITLIFHVDSIVSFAFPMMIGMASGVFSSVCLVPCLWVTWQEYSAKKKEAAQK